MIYDDKVGDFIARFGAVVLGAGLPGGFRCHRGDWGGCSFPGIDGGDGEGLAGGGRGVGCYRPESEGMLNAIEPGSPLPIHRHPTKDESFVIPRGKVRVTTHKDDGAVIGDVVLRCERGNYGVDISKGVWHMVEALELGGIFECEGAFGEHEEEGVLEEPANEEVSECRMAVLQIRRIS